MNTRLNLQRRSFFHELPYFGQNIILDHGQFNNCLSSHLPSKKYLETLCSIYDLDLFSLNTGEAQNPDFNLNNHRIQSRYFSPHSFNFFKNKLHRYADNSCFSLLHNNVRSLKRNLENFQVHLLDELDCNFSLIGVSETKINNLKDVDFDPNIPGYVFEHVPTPLASGGVGLYINDSLKYTVIEKTSEVAFQALWIEIKFTRKSNIICGIIYRQHNSPQRFQEYFDLTFEKLISSNLPVYIMGDFNINLLHAETSRYAYDFLISMQSFSFIPTIDKPTRVYNNSATLIDNILTNKVDVKITSGNIISDISDHYSQFCVSHTSPENSKSRGKRFRDFSGFSEVTFNLELYNLLSNQISHGDDSFDVDKAFSHFYDSLNVLVNKHVPLKKGLESYS